MAMSQRDPSGPDIATQRFVVLCRDGQGSASLRALTLDAHRTYVDTWSKSIVLSGPLVDDDGLTRIGQFYVVDVDSRAGAEEFVANDPFTIAGVFASVEITRILSRYFHGSRSTDLVD